MILPDPEDLKFQQLITLLDENSLLRPTIGRFETALENQIRGLVLLPDSPRLGPETMASLHALAASVYPEPEWESAHRYAESHYQRRADDLFDRGQQVLARSGAFGGNAFAQLFPDEPEPEPEPTGPELDLLEASRLVGELVTIWEESGRTNAASTQLLLLARAVRSVEPDLAAGLSFLVAQHHCDPGNLVAWAQVEQGDARATAADANLSLAQSLPARRREFLCRGLELAFWSLNNDRTHNSPAIASLEPLAASLASDLQPGTHKHDLLTQLASAAGDAVRLGTALRVPDELAARYSGSGLSEPDHPDADYRVSRRLSRLPDGLASAFPAGPAAGPAAVSDPTPADLEARILELLDPPDSHQDRSLLDVSSASPDQSVIPLPLGHAGSQPVVSALAPDHDTDALRCQLQVVICAGVHRTGANLDAGALRGMLNNICARFGSPGVRTDPMPRGSTPARSLPAGAGLPADGAGAGDERPVCPGGSRASSNLIPDAEPARSRTHRGLQ